MSEGHHSPTNIPPQTAAAAAADRSSMQSIELMGKEEVSSSKNTVNYPKFTRLNLTAIPVRQVTKRWDNFEDDAEANLDDITDLRKDLPDVPKTCGCVSVSMILTFLFYLVCIGTVPLMVVVLGNFLDWYKETENCANTTSTSVLVDEITGMPICNG